MINIFKRKKPKPPFDYEEALAKLSAECCECKAFSAVFASVYYDAKRGKYVAHFECAQKEYLLSSKRNKFFLSIRRDEKFWCASLESLLDYAITYAGYPDAFRISPRDNLPEGITMAVRNFTRSPHNNSLSWKV